MSEKIELMKRQIERQIDEYAADIAAYDAWMADWRARQPKGFRAKRRPAPQSEADSMMDDQKPGRPKRAA